MLPCYQPVVGGGLGLRAVGSARNKSSWCTGANCYVNKSCVGERKRERTSPPHPKPKKENEERNLLPPPPSPPLSFFFSRKLETAELEPATRPGERARPVLERRTRKDEEETEEEEEEERKLEFPLAVNSFTALFLEPLTKSSLIFDRSCRPQKKIMESSESTWKT